MTSVSPAPHRVVRADYVRALWALFLLLLTWHLFAAWLLPVTNDEAYYFDWSRHLAWGYFDHPPGVAVMGVGVRLLPGSVWVARLGTVLSSALTFLVLLSWYRRSGLSGRALLTALVLAATNFILLVYGFIDNPDVLLLLFWALAMREATLAVQGKRGRWLSAGVAVGLGMLSKYTMVLILPVLLWGLWRGDRQALRTPWPWLGALLSLAILMPNLHWNIQHGGGSLLFQFNHGFGVKHQLAMPSAIPGAEAPAPTAGATAVHSVKHHPGIAGILGYVGGQAALFGILLIALLPALWRRKQMVPGAIGVDEGPAQPLSDGVKALLLAGTLVPLVFFAAFAGWVRVQANWPAPWILSFAPLAALFLQRQLRWLLAGTAVNLLLLSVVLAHADTGFLPIKPGKDRILRETHGYQALAERIAKLPGHVFTDRYQMAAMLRFYDPALQIGQWPGVGRPSEYMRGTLVHYPTLTQIRAEDGFWFLSRDMPAPTIAGYNGRLVRALYDCKTGPVSEQSCASPIHRWLLYRYRER